MSDDENKVIRLVERSNSALHWTPERMLEQALEEWRAGEIHKTLNGDEAGYVHQMKITWWIEMPDGSKRLRRYIAGMRSEEIITMCAVEQSEEIDDMVGGD